MFRNLAFALLFGIAGTVACSKDPPVAPPPPVDPCAPPNLVNGAATTVTFFYSTASPDFRITVAPEVYYCTGWPVKPFGGGIISHDDGNTYQADLPPMLVNYPNGSKPHRIRVARVFINVFERWLDGSEFTLNGVHLTAHSEVEPPPSNCASCKPGVFWYFKVDSDGRVRP